MLIVSANALKELLKIRCETSSELVRNGKITSQNCKTV